MTGGLLLQDRWEDDDGRFCSGGPCCPCRTWRGERLVGGRSGAAARFGRTSISGAGWPDWAVRANRAGFGGVGVGRPIAPGSSIGGGQQDSRMAWLVEDCDLYGIGPSVAPIIEVPIKTELTRDLVAGRLLQNAAMSEPGRRPPHPAARHWSAIRRDRAAPRCQPPARQCWRAVARITVRMDHSAVGSQGGWLRRPAPCRSNCADPARTSWQHRNRTPSSPLVRPPD